MNPWPDPWPWGLYLSFTVSLNLLRTWCWLRPRLHGNVTRNFSFFRFSNMSMLTGRCCENVAASCWASVCQCSELDTWYKTGTVSSTWCSLDNHSRWSSVSTLPLSVEQFKNYCGAHTETVDSGANAILTVPAGATKGKLFLNHLQRSSQFHHSTEMIFLEFHTMYCFQLVLLELWQCCLWYTYRCLLLIGFVCLCPLSSSTQRSISAPKDVICEQTPSYNNVQVPVYLYHSMSHSNIFIGTQMQHFLSRKLLGHFQQF